MDLDGVAYVRSHPGLASTERELAGSIYPHLARTVPDSPADAGRLPPNFGNQGGIKKMPAKSRAVQTTILRHPGISSSASNGSIREKYLVDKNPLKLMSVGGPHDEDRPYNPVLDPVQPSKEPQLFLSAKVQTAAAKLSAVERLQAQVDHGFGEGLQRGYGFPDKVERVKKPYPVPTWKMDPKQSKRVAVPVLRGNKPVGVPGASGVRYQPKVNGASYDAYKPAPTPLPLSTEKPVVVAQTEAPVDTGMSDADFIQATKYSNVRERCESIYLDYADRTEVPETITNEYADLGCGNVYNFGEIGTGP